MYCFVTVVLLLLPLFQTLPSWRCLVVTASSILSVVQYISKYIGRKNCMGLVCCKTKAIPALYHRETNIQLNEEEKQIFIFLFSTCRFCTILYLKETSVIKVFHFSPKTILRIRNIDQNSYFNFSYSYSLSSEGLPVACSNALQNFA